MLLERDKYLGVILIRFMVNHRVRFKSVILDVMITAMSFNSLYRFMLRMLLEVRCWRDKRGVRNE